MRLAAAEAMAQLGEVKEGLNTAVGKGFLLGCVFFNIFKAIKSLKVAWISGLD